MAIRELTISLQGDCEVEAINIKAGERKNYDTVVDVLVGQIIILGVSIIDDHLAQTTAHLPSG